MHMMAAGLAEAVEQAGRRRSATRRRCRRSSGSPTDRCAACNSARREPRAPSCSKPTPWSAIPIFRSRTASCSTASTFPDRAANGKYSPSCLLWVAGVKGLPPADASASQHPLRPRLGRFVQGADRRRRADARPVDPRHAAQPRRPLAGTGGTLEHLRAGAHTESERHDRLVAGARRHRRRPAPTHGVARLPDRRRARSRSTTRRTGSGWAWSRARRSRSPTRSSRPDRSDRTTSPRRSPDWSSPDRPRCPVSACRWCSCPASSPPNASTEYAATR